MITEKNFTDTEIFIQKNQCALGDICTWQMQNDSLDQMSPDFYHHGKYVRFDSKVNMQDIVRLETSEQFTIRGHLVQSIEVLPEARTNIAASSDKIISIFLNHYTSKAAPLILEDDEMMIFEDRIRINQKKMDIEFIFRFIKGHIIITKVEIAL